MEKGLILWFLPAAVVTSLTNKWHVQNANELVKKNQMTSPIFYVTKNELKPDGDMVLNSSEELQTFTVVMPNEMCDKPALDNFKDERFNIIWQHFRSFVTLTRHAVSGLMAKSKKDLINSLREEERDARKKIAQLRREHFASSKRKKNHELDDDDDSSDSSSDEDLPPVEENEDFIATQDQLKDLKKQMERLNKDGKKAEILTHDKRGMKRVWCCFYQMPIICFGFGLRNICK